MSDDIVVLAMQLAAMMKEKGAAMVPWSTLHELECMCSDEMMYRTMPECAYAEVLLRLISLKNVTTP